MRKSIVRTKDNNTYFFDEEYDFDYYKDKKDLEFIGYVNSKNSVGVHECVKSALYDNLDGYVDELQEEMNLPDDKMFVVTYYKAELPFSLIHCVDFAITKQQIIENVLAQKYVEAAEYFTMEQLEVI